MSDLLNETFEGATLPAGWNFGTGYSITNTRAQAGTQSLLQNSRSNGTAGAIYNTQFQADTVISVCVYADSAGGSSGKTFLFARDQTGSSAENAGSKYVLQFKPNLASTSAFQIQVINGGTASNVVATGSSSAITFALDTWYLLTFECKGSTIRAKAQRLSDGLYLQPGGVTWGADNWVLSGTNSVVTNAGYAGFTAATGTSTPYFYFDNYRVTDGGTVALTDVPLTYANWSPYNWFKNGSAYYQTNNPGAYFELEFFGTDVGMTFDPSNLAGLADSDCPLWKYSIDGKPFVSIRQTSQMTGITLGTGLTNGAHKIKGWLIDYNNTLDWWNSSIGVGRVVKFGINSGGYVTPITPKPNNIIAFGDSTFRGVKSSSTGTNDGQTAPALVLGLAMNAEVGIVAYGSQGWAAGGLGVNSAPFYSATPANASWCNYHAGQSRLVNGKLDPPPTLVVLGHGTADYTNARSTGTIQSTVPAAITAIRAASASTTGIAISLPMGRFASYVTAITNGFNAYQSSTPDDKCKLVDLGVDASYGVNDQGASYKSADGVHWYAYENARWAAIFQRQYDLQTLPATGGGGTVTVNKIATKQIRRTR